MSSSDRVQTVRNAWINAIRAEVLRVDVPELPRIAAVAMWIATYADADGGNSFPSRETLARLVGGSKETVTRAVKVLAAVGLLERVRRPNQSSVYQLLIPTQRPDWKAHIHLYADTRQRKYREKQKAREMAEHLARKASPAGAYQYLPTSGRDPHTDQETAEHSPQPQVRAGTRRENDHSPPGPAAPDDPARDFRRCTTCGDPMAPRPGRTTHAHCTPGDTT